MARNHGRAAHAYREASVKRAFRFALLAVIFAAPVSGQFLRGEVEFVTSAAYWVAWPDFPSVADCCGDIGLYKQVPYFADQFLTTGPNVMVFHDGHTMSFWDGSAVPVGDSRPAYTTIFTDSAHLTEIAPMRPNRFLVASDTKLIAFDVRQKIREIPFAGAKHIELLGDDCTLLYTKADEVVRRMNVCTGAVEPDFASLLPNETAGSIRQLPNGHVLVAATTGVVEFQQDGSFWTYDSLVGVTHIALAPDGASFWAGSTNGQLFRVDPNTMAATAVMTGYTGKPIEIRDLVVAGEWRASATPAHMRAVRPR